MDKMVDHLFVFEGGGTIKDIIGNYTEYRKQSSGTKKTLAQENKKTESEPVAQAVIPLVASSEKKKLSFKEKEEFRKIEEELEKLEIEKEKWTVVLSDAGATGEEIVKAGNQLTEVMNKIEKHTERWMELAEYI